MPYNSFTRPLGHLVEARERVMVCYDQPRTSVWLELTNTKWMVGGHDRGFVTAFIGAVKTPTGWKAIDQRLANALRFERRAFGDTIQNVPRFQRAICSDWQSFTPGTAERFAKGLSFGRDMSSASFVMKALKTGFDAVGVSTPAGDGMRLHGFTVGDILGYLEARKHIKPAYFADSGLEEFLAFGADPQGQEDEDKPVKSIGNGDRRDLRHIQSRKEHGHSGKFAYAEETAHIKLPRVIGYGFRGDSRPPSQIKDAGGFLPNYTRPDHIKEVEDFNTNARLQSNFKESDLIRDDQALDLVKFIGDQKYGGYNSVSKSYSIAKAFATNVNGTVASGTTGEPPLRSGWVYACHVEGAFIMPKGRHNFTVGDNKAAKIAFNEQELSQPGLLDWEDIVACRRVNRSGHFDGLVYIKGALFREDASAAGEIFYLLSGRTQGKVP